MYKFSTLIPLILLSALISSNIVMAFDDEDDMTVDRADSSDFEAFHEKDDSITLWSSDGEGIFSKKEEVSTYDSSDEKNTTSTTENAKKHSGGIEETILPQSSSSNAGKVSAPKITAAAGSIDKTFSTGDSIKVREAYKLSSDPKFTRVPTLYEAMLSLHSQLNRYCPKGWTKKKEWHLPHPDGFYFIHYSVTCD